MFRDGINTTVDFGEASSSLFAINNLGEVAGASFPNGGFFTGPYTGFIATPTPEPGTAMLVTAGVLLAGLLMMVGREKQG